MKSVLIENIRQKPLEKQMEIISEHCLEGYMHFNFPKQYSLFRNIWISQHVKNTIHHKELFKVSKECKRKEIKITILKGMSLCHSAYRDFGERSMGDIDLLVSLKDASTLSTILTELKYVELKERKWRANHFKKVFEKSIENTTVVIELHTQLTYQENKVSIEWRTRKLSTYDQYQLTYEDQLLYLSIHLAHQHTFLFLHWLLDIELLLSKNSDLDWSYIFSQASLMKVKRSLATVLYTLDHYCDANLSDNVKIFYQNNMSKSLVFLIDFNFLCYPHSKRIKYIFIKHLLRDSLTEAFLYDFFWLRSKCYDKLGKN